MSKPSRQSLEKRISRSLEAFERGDLDDALLHIVPVVDVTAKARHKSINGVGNRIRQFIDDEQNIIYYLSYAGTVKIPDGVTIKMVPDHDVGARGTTLADVLYSIRNSLVHNAEIDLSDIDFGRDFGICRERFDGPAPDPGKFIVSKATILGLILAVLAAPENRTLRLGLKIKLYNRISVLTDDVAGNKKLLLQELDALFQQKDTANA